MTEEKKMGRTPRKDKNIHQRLNSAMAEVNYIKKDKKITMGGGGFKVTGHDAVTKLIHPLLVKHGISLIPSVEDMTQEGNRTVVKMNFDWVNIDDPMDFFQNKCYAYGIDNQDKGPGKAISYAQRYIVLKTLHLETGEKDIEEHDTDFKETKEVKVVQTPNAPISNNHPEYDKKLSEPITGDLKKDIIDLGYALKWQAPKTMGWVGDNFGGKKIGDLTCEEGMQCLDKMANITSMENGDDVPL
jgi:hypothetical protein